MVKLIRVFGFFFVIGLLFVIGKVGWELAKNDGELLATIDKDLDKKRKESILFKPDFNVDRDVFKITRKSISDSGNLDDINRIAFYPKENPCGIKWTLEFDSFKKGMAYSLKYDSNDSCEFNLQQLEYIHTASIDQINKFVDFKKVSHLELVSTKNLPIDIKNPDALGAFLIKLFKIQVREESTPSDIRKFNFIQN